MTPKENLHMATRAKNTLPVNYAEQLAKEAAEISKRISTPSGDRVRFSSNRANHPDGNEGEELEVVVIDFVSALVLRRPVRS